MSPATLTSRLAGWALALALACLPAASSAQLLLTGAGPNPGAVAAGSAPANILAVDGNNATSSQTVSGTTAICPTGSDLWVLVHAGGSVTNISALADDSGLGNTYAGGGAVAAGGRLVLFRVKLTSDLPAGAKFTATMNAAAAAQFVADCFPSGTAFLDTSTVGAAATSANPSLTTSSISSSPVYVVFGLWSGGSINAATPNGAFVQLGKDQTSSFGIALFWQKYSGATGATLTFAPTGMSSFAWGLTYNTGTTP